MSKVKEEYVRKAKATQRVYHYAFDYTNKVWRPLACDENGKTQVIE